MRIFISYSHKDKAFCDELLTRLKAAGRVYDDIGAWDDTQIQAGSRWHGEIQTALAQAEVILLLVSTDFLASDYIYDQELALALEREQVGGVIVVPVILRATPYWQQTSFGHLQAPNAGKPVKYPANDDAWEKVIVGLVEMAKKKGLLTGPPRPFDRGPAAKPGGPAIFRVPLAKNDFFIGRDGELAWIEQAFASPDRRPVALLAGMGGVGKTTAAAEFAHKHHNAYPVVWWVESENPIARDNAFAGLAQALKLPGVDFAKPAAVRPAVLHWLSTNPNWLLIYDNAVDPGDLKEWLPLHPAGHILITSRNDAWGRLAQRQRVKKWDEETAASFLLQRGESRDGDTARALAEKLDGLPLACEQAAAYIEANHLSLRAYAERLDQRLAQLLDEGAPDEHPSLTATVQMALESLEAENPLALEILRVLAWYAPDDIPRDMLERWCLTYARTVWGYLWAGVRGRLATPEKVGVAFQVLFRRALQHGDGEMLSFHRLVQALVRTFDPDPAASQGTAVRLLHDNLGRCGHPQLDIQHWSRLGALLPHGQALFAALSDPPPDPGAAAYVCCMLGMFLQYARGDLPAARAWYERAATIEAHRPADDPELATSISNLGSVLDDLGELDAAEGCYRRALVVAEACFGPDHPAVAIRVNNLGLLLWKKNDLAGAKECFERALKIDGAALGPDRPEVAVWLGNFGLVLQDQGDLTGAKDCFEQALRIDQADYGPVHPAVARGLNNLAIVLGDLGDHTGAVDHHHRALAIWEKLLPPTHPDRLRSQRNLAMAEADLAASRAGFAGHHPPPGRGRGFKKRRP